MKFELISTKILFEKLFFKLEEATFRHEKFTGGMSEAQTRISFERGDGVSIVLHDPAADTVVMVEQFRYSTQRHGQGWLLELPAGVLKPGERPEDAMRREVEEETGYHIQKIEPISTFYLSPGGSSERIFLFYAQVSMRDQLSKGGGLIEEGEDLRVAVHKLDEIYPKIASGEIMDAKTIIGLQWLQLRRHTKR